MRTALWMLGLVFAPETSEALRPTYTDGQVLTTYVVLERFEETTAFEMLRDGEPVEGRGPMGDMSGQSRLAFQQRDEILEEQDGLPTKLRREYSGCERMQARSFGDESIEGVFDAPLDGVLLEFVRDEDGEVQIEVKEGGSPDAERVDALPFGFVLDDLLPDQALAVGDSFELSAEALRGLLFEELGLLLFEQEQQESGFGGSRSGAGGPGRGSSRDALESADWEGSATLESIDEGLAQLRITMEASGELAEREGRFGGGPRALGSSWAPRFASTYEHRFEGLLVFSIEQARPMSLELEGDSVWNSERVFERDDSRTEIRSTRVGSFELTLRVELTE